MRNEEQLKRYQTMIEEKNKAMNLTGFSGKRLWEEGIYESIKSLSGFNINGTLLDIGAGAGFPSVPFLIENNNINLTIIEPLQKRVRFLKDVREKLNLNIEFITKRAEEVKDIKADFITARAVAPLFKLIEISFDLGKVNSEFIFIKGPNIDNEIEDAKKIIDKLSISYEVVKKKIGNKSVNIFHYKKTIETPNCIPRNWAQIKK